MVLGALACSSDEDTPSSSAGGTASGGAGMSGRSGQGGAIAGSSTAGSTAAGGASGGAAGGGAVSGGTASGGTASGGTASGGTASGGTASGGTASGGASAGVVSKGGTMTFRKIGAPGYWGRRIEAEPGDAKCDVQGEYVNVFGTQEYCCRTKHEVTHVPLAPFNEEMTMVLRGPLHIEQFVMYQPGVGAGAAWAAQSRWEQGAPATLADVRFVGPNGSKAWTGDLGDGCHWYAMRAEPFACGAGSDPFCPAGGPDLHFKGWAGSKLLILRASMPDASVPGQTAASCQTDGTVSDSPWVGWSASELMRDGAGKYHPCHCYANTNPGVGDGCGEINVWETVSEKEVGYGNRAIMSTGLRSFQVGSLGGSVCGAPGCGPDLFGDDIDLVDACKQAPLATGAVLEPGGNNGCPVWQRPKGVRYFVALLDEATSTVKIALIHPQNVPASLGSLLPSLPATIDRSTVDALVALSLPAGG